MKPGDIAAGAGRLQDSVKSIHLRWDETKDVWNDARRAEFDAQFMEPIEPQVRMTLEKLRKLATVFHQACQECNDSNQ